MPTYEYACKSCGEHLEVVQAFTDDALTTCPACGGLLRKVFGNIGISFKGSGFYRNDSRAGSRSGRETQPGTDTKTAGSDTPKEAKETSGVGGDKGAKGGPGSGGSGSSDSGGSGGGPKPEGSGSGASAKPTGPAKAAAS